MSCSPIPFPLPRPMLIDHSDGKPSITNYYFLSIKREDVVCDELTRSLIHKPSLRKSPLSKVEKHGLKLDIERLYIDSTLKRH